MHLENLFEILENAPLEKRRSAAVYISTRNRNTAILTANLYKEMAPFFEKGITTEQEELDFCCMVDAVLDEGGLRNQNARADILNQIYDATGFPHLYKG